MCPLLIFTGTKHSVPHPVAAAAKEEEMRVWQIAEKCWTVASDGGRAEGREGGEGESVIVLSVSDWCETDGGERGGEIRKVAAASAAEVL